jgi:hypothetical protein
MADGGKPADGILIHLDDQAWEAFGREFLAGDATTVGS